MPIYQTNIAFEIATDITGVATLSVKIPGTFGGLTPADPSNLRYFKQAKIWSPSIVDGDLIDQVRIVDTDGVIPSQMRGAFAAYPIIVDFTQDAPGNAGVIPGVYLESSEPVIINAFGDNIQAVPCGLYFTARFTAGAVSLGRKLRGNIIWGRYSAI